MNLICITQPTIEPITVPDVEGQILFDLSSQLDFVELNILAVREQAESITSRALITQTWELRIDNFEDKIVLPLPPLQTVDFIKYIDIDGVEQTLNTTEYTVYNKCEPGYIKLAYNKYWPSIRQIDQAITIRFTCGYGSTASSVPNAIKKWMLLNVANLIENRESIVIGNSRDSVVDLTTTLADGLISNYRMYKL